MRIRACWFAIWGVMASALALTLLALPACASKPSAATSAATPTAVAPTPVTRATATPVPAPPYAGTTYTDAKLGFRLLVPSGWRAVPQPGTRAAASTTTVLLESGQNATIQVAVMRGPGMPATFAQRGAPGLRVGAYPGFSADTSLREGKVPCLVRLFLAGQDYVIADWCAMDDTAHTAQFGAVLATYQPAATGFTPAAPSAPPPQSCAQAQATHGYNAAGWGRMLAPPNGGAGPYQLGAYVCSNTGSPDRYLFQCTELINRVIRELWGLYHVPGSAARYFDYYQDGTRHPGNIRDLPAGSYQYSDDASQGTSAFKPRIGDLLVFQDVTAPRVGWTSGLTTSPGHIAIITGVDAGNVYVAQENYSDSQYFMALPMATTAHGYAITDRSGIPNRIVRGWIHFTANGGPAD
ncbi:MAG: CHAP domain-containing protein [Ktedonobacterales bacterium]|nr:CHAP domain-containing protein [Ktedonobacterales bacterium]